MRIIVNIICRKDWSSSNRASLSVCRVFVQQHAQAQGWSLWMSHRHDCWCNKGIDAMLKTALKLFDSSTTRRLNQNTSHLERVAHRPVIARDAGSNRSLSYDRYGLSKKPLLVFGAPRPRPHIDDDALSHSHRAGRYNLQVHSPLPWHAIKLALPATSLWYRLNRQWSSL